MSAQPDWMPVFVMAEAAVQRQFAAHPSHEGPVKAPVASGKDFVQRVGTAIRSEDGSYAIQLTALPVNGKLMMRPARTDEYIDPTLSDVES
ncbi:MAG TPA: hypothetical protein VLU73_09385 [Methylococcaceae bacterium]|nr:hypothetical protein [Methylococcaceae bacterium]